MGNDDAGLIRPDKDTLTYERYLKVRELLNLQKTLSSPEEHDETLFIIIHQVYELWFKQILHELKLCNEQLDSGHLMRVMHALKRIDTIQKVLIHQIDILETMPPDDFSRFRDHLNPASGFQSFQFREVEYRLGLKDERYLQFHNPNPDVKAHLEKVLEQPSIYDHFLRMLQKRGYQIPSAVLERPTRAPHELNEELVKVFLTVYQKPYDHSDIYLALEALLDLDEQFILWRYRHVAMVERMIGNSRGTGGSLGAKYLASTLQKRAFPEIWEVRNYLGKSPYSSHSTGR